MNPPANWYPDPTGRHGQRYWDGEQWTEHVFTDGVQGVDPLEQALEDADEATDETADETADDATDETAADTGTDEAEADDGPGDDLPPGGLFADAGSADAWSPQDQVGDGDEASEAVATEVEAEDVVASLDEVSDAPAAAGDVEEGEADEVAEIDAPPATGDMSDAFVLAPETASRIVKRRATTEPETSVEEVDVDGAGADGASEPESEPEPDVAHEASASTEEEPPSTGAIDAPPPSTAPSSAVPPGAAPPAAGASTASGGLGITGDLLGGAFAERSDGGPVALQNSRLLRCSITPGAAVVARQGTMVAYQGDVSFDRQGAGGVTRALKRAATGEGLAMMRAEGSGDVFFADGAQHVFLLELAGGPGLSVNGRNVLAFSAALAWDIQRVKGASLLAGGLFNTTFTGSGWVALVSDGEPVVLHTDEAPTHVDVNALVAWSAGLSTRIVSSVTAKSLVGLGSGEAFQMAFDGTGIVIVQPSEGPMAGAAAT